MKDPVPLELLAKRQILYGKGGEKRMRPLVHRLLGEGRLAEALEYLDRTRDPADLDMVRRAAVAAGDAFSLHRAAQFLKTTPDPSEWRELARVAEGRERWYDAVNALERAGEAEKAEELRSLRCPDYRPFRPAGK